jgi:hypothetical protein
LLLLLTISNHDNDNNYTDHDDDDDNDNIYTDHDDDDDNDNNKVSMYIERALKYNHHL